MEMAWDLENNLTMSIIKLVIGLLAMSGNMLILLIFIKFPMFRKVQSNVLISLLAASSLVVGFGIVIRAIHTIFFYNPLQCNRSVCLLIGQPQVIGLIYGQILLLALALDRYSAVRWPCNYLQIDIKLRVIVILVFCTLLSIFFIALAIHGLSDEPCSQCTIGATTTHLYHAIWLGIGAFNAVLVIGLYLKAVKLLHIQLNSKCTKHFHTIRVHQHAFISISLVVLCYAIFWCIPVFGSILAYISNANDTIRGYMSITFGLGEGLNSSLTVVIYLVKHREVRQCVKKLLNIHDKVNMNIETVNRKSQLSTH
ncbi:unnamed protein product [Bursaphelenchus okinawaensis]|uniref:G-protein coupled receptors family 1 profile domain-containing protein n=1 Tax=Bursaphelenchus okinawaensis TaxID=465554 RepID=A0A811K8V9_9BILA|nr:unnamed protein product [Bursaphelenchus okinawaensis]CAG9096702.1 unnamed protein product [Bursaphelenchus okinawaensis]